MTTLEFTAAELVHEPQARSLVTGKSIMVFNIKISEKTTHLNTGNKFDYENESYEIMTREPVQAPVSYLKFNCVRKVRKIV